MIINFRNSHEKSPVSQLYSVSPGLPECVRVAAQEEPPTGMASAARAPALLVPQSPTQQGAQAPLGNSAKSSSASHSKYRADRFLLQSVSRLLLPKERVRNCLRAVVKGGSAVGVWASEQHQRAHFKGLQTCSSVWHCPVCAAKVSERRRLELQAAIDVHRSSGGDVLLLTLTTRHHKRDRLSDLLDGQKKALARLWSGRAAQRLFSEWGIEGSIRALEVLHGSNGWHPHYHIILFVTAPVLALPSLRNTISIRWCQACESVGLPVPDPVHGVDLRDGSYAAGYAAKWGMAEELTRGHTKSGKAKGQTPWDLLRNVADTGEAEPARLFQDYAKVFKGKRQLYWSPGLKNRFLIDEQSDEQVASRIDEGSRLLGLLSLDQWRRIVKAEARSSVLDAAERGWPAVCEVLAGLP